MRSMTIEEYIEFEQTGERDESLRWPEVEDYNRAQEIMVDRGIIDKPVFIGKAGRTR